MRKFLMVVFALAVGCHTLFAESGTCGNNLTWNLNDSVLTIRGSGSMKNYNTSSSPAPWYSIRASINRVIIEEGVTSIGNDAFEYCENLKSVDLPNGITNIGSGAFCWCKNLTSIYIPSTVKTTGYCAFEFCNKLKRVEISDLEAWCKISFAQDGGGNPLCNRADLYLNGNLVENLVIPNGVARIGYSAFFGCRSLKSVIIPNSVTTIGKLAFGLCSNLYSVTIGHGVSSIAEAAFLECDSLNMITIPNSVTSIGNRAFSGCVSLASVIIPSSVTRLGESAFSACSSLTSVIIPDGVSSIEKSTFSGCSSLTSVTIPNSVTTIGISAFSGCSNLAFIAIPNSVMSIGSYAFYYCSSLTSVIIPDGVNSIENYTFSGCKSMTSIAIPNSVTTIGISAFSGCSNLASIAIPDSVTSIGESAFYGCKSLTLVTIPVGVYSIEKCTFYGCQSLTSVTIPNSVTCIRYWAFYECTSLTSVTIPNSVINIEEGAFFRCSSLTSVTIPNSVKSIGKSAFYGCKSMTSVSIPNSVTSIGDYTFYVCSSLTSVTIPNSVTSIGACAFSNCYGLTSVTISNSVTSIASRAFESCGNISNIFFQGSLLEWCESVVPPVLMKGWAGGNLYLQNSLLTQATIPSSITTIKDYTFNKCTSLTSVSIPESVTSIGSCAYYGCSGLTSLMIPNSVTSIGTSAFGNCKSLDSLALHCKLDSVANNTFSNCQNIRYLGVCLTDSAPNIKKLFSGSLTKKVKELELFPGSTCCGTPVGGNNHLPFMGNTSVEKIIIPANIAVIPDSCFMNCTKLKEVSIGLIEASGDENTHVNTPKSVKAGGNSQIERKTYVGQDCFNGDKSLTEVIFAGGVEEIGQYACQGLKNLKHIELPSTLKHINQGAFEGCGLTEIEIPASMDNAYGLDGRVFANNTDLEKVVINCYADQCRTNSNNRRDQFEGCENIKSITLKTKHDSPALNELFSPTVINNLEELIYLPNTTEIPMMFNSTNCKFSKLMKLVLPEGLQKIWGGNFYGCNNIKLELPSSLNNISGDAFKDCRFNGIVSRAEEAPVLDNDVFLNVSRSTTVGVPDKSKYMNKNIWEEFYLYAKNDHQPTTLATNEVNVTTTNNSATVSYPVAAGGSSASITLASQSTGEEYTYYNTDIPVDEANMPRRTTRENDMDSFAGYSFTIQSLEANTTYDYTVTIYNSTEEVLAEYTGSFTTLEDEATAIDQISNDPSQLPNKLLRNGQILILRGDHTYTVTGQEVK